MKRFFCIVCIVALIFTGLSFCDENHDVIDAKDNAYDIVLVTLSQGKVSITRYATAETLKKCEHIFSVDLADTNELYDTLTCSQENRHCIVVHSEREAIGDYILNWATMVGIDGTYIMNAVPLNVTLTRQDEDSTLIKINRDSDYLADNLELIVDQPVKSACAFALPCTLLDSMCAAQETMSFADGCKFGVIVAHAHNECVDNVTDDLEIEFEQIIDSMLKDGTIKIKEVGPVMARLRTIGSVIFVKCIVAKQALCSWWHNFWHQQDYDKDESSIQV
ncbi:MAG TPA: hypothetical protein PKD74_05290 [Candidatus Dependentiae bacterium]|nr:hypothetical protein [Candidatus Dependentiae bacterium]